MKLAITSAVWRVAMCGAAAVIFAMAVPQLGFAQADPMIGTWKVNLAKSTYSPGPPPRSVTSVVTRTDQGLTAAIDGIDAQGMPVRQMIPMICDGQSHAVPGAVPVFDANSCRRPDPYTIEVTRTMAGMTVLSGTIALSRDGKTITITDKGVAPNGQQINNVTVWDKQ